MKKFFNEGRKGKSCLSNLLEFLDEVMSFVDKGVPVDVVYLDFQKAFDKVPHKRLLHKLEKFGVAKGLVKWIGEWLSNRKQRVVIDGVCSEWESVWSGVPQGSVLGPILFVLFIDDIDKNVASKVLKFADDTKLLGRVDGEENRRVIQEDLRKLFGWSQDWRMLFNVDKCGVMHLGYYNERKDLMLGDVVLGVLKEEKDLGVMMQDDLKVAKQCNKAANTANRMLGMIKRNFVSRGREILLPLYKSVVRPHLDYCVQAWRPHFMKDISRLEKVQRRMTKMVTGCGEMSYEERLVSLGLMTFEMRMKRADMIEVYKIMSGKEKTDESIFFERSKLGTRGHSMKLRKRGFESDVGKFSFANRVVDEWNGLSQHVVEAESLGVFKGRLDHHLRSYGGIN